MAQTSISTPYKRLSKITAGLLCLAWAIYGLGLIFLVWQYGAVLSAHWEPLIKICAFLALLLGGGWLFAGVPFFLLSASEEAGMVFANEDGLTLPSGLFGLGAPHMVHWSDLATIDVVPDGSADMLVLILRDGKAVNANLEPLGADAERIMLAIEIWAPSAVWTGRAMTTRDELQNAKVGIPSFTRMWDEELGRRFSSTAFVPLDPGTKLQSGRITITHQIGFGGFSAVYLAKTDDGLPAVVKEALFPSQNDHEESQQQREMFHREARLLAELDHPHVCKIMDEFVEAGRSYLTLEYIEGENLRDLVRHSGALPEQQVRRFAVQMADVLDYLHSRTPPVIHRDFTPDNMVMSGAGEIHLVDFGAANEYLERATGTFVGKQCYMAPEQVRGKGEPASDFYSLGCTLYFLLTGKDPEPLSQSRPRAINPDVSPQLDDLVAALTSFEAAHRPCLSSTVRERLDEKTNIIKVSPKKETVQ